MTGLLGKKIGITNIFDQEGYSVPVTLIEAGPCSVLGTKTKGKDGYCAVILGYGETKASKLKRPQKGWFEKLNVDPKKTIREIRTDDLPACKAGDKIGVNIFKTGDYVDVTGITIGKGFQGGVKRWKWKGGEKGHGSMFHRAPGSIGASSFPSRVHKGHHLPGRMGGVRRTIQNLRVMTVDEERHLLVVKGSVPGHKDRLLILRCAKKKKSQHAEKNEK